MPEHLNFANTEIAFKHYSTDELKRARMLFNMFKFKFLIKYGPGLASGALKYGIPVKPLIRKTIFDHFCGGESIADCDESVKRMYTNGVGAILDYSVEGVESEANFDLNCDEILATVHKADAHDEYPFAVFKATGVGRLDLFAKVHANEDLSVDEKAEFDRIVARIDRICKQAAESNVRIFIDAEESWIQRPIDDLVEAMMARYNGEHAWVYQTVQLYRKERLGYMHKCLEEAKTGSYKLGFKLVRGAYMEKERERAEEKGYPSPIQDTKEDTDADYNRAIEFCIEHRDMVSLCAGTHNEESSQVLLDLLQKHGLAKDDERFWFAQLYGMSDHISYNLAHHGYNVAKYLPYGPIQAVLPYLGRRAQENTSVQGQTSRELNLLELELSRRKKQSQMYAYRMME
jgi:proline dehydrogenase